MPRRNNNSCGNEQGHDTEQEVLEENKPPELYGALSMEEHALGESIFDVYEKVECLAEDGIGGDVWIVKKKLHGQNSLYVMKYIEKDFLFGILLKELRNEVESLRNIDHPHVIRTYETFETRKFLYLVMEYCSGGDLWSRPLPYSESEAARVLTQILSAVAHCHKQKVVHRDLKLENVMFRTEAPDSDVLLIDFGLSQRYRRARGAGDYSMKMQVGTNYTMSPQVIEGRYTEKTDLWSVGVIAYTMLSGKKPFDADTTKDILPLVSEGEYCLEGPEWESISQDAKEFITSLLEYDPHKRFSAEEALQSTWLQKNCPSQEPEPEIMTQVEDALLRSIEEPKLKRFAKMIIAHSSPAEKLQELRQAFGALDHSQDGTITLEEFQTTLQRSEGGSNLSADQFKEIFEELDQSQAGIIHYTDFLSATLETQVDIDDQELTDAFEKLDVHNKGCITKEDLLETLEPTCKHTHTNSENVADELFKEVHADNSAEMITFEEFTEMFQENSK